MSAFPSLAHLLPLAGLPGGWEAVVVLLVILLLFGRRIPGVMRSIGQGISSFRQGLSEGDRGPDEESERRPLQDRKGGGSPLQGGAPKTPASAKPQDDVTV